MRRLARPLRGGRPLSHSNLWLTFDPPPLRPGFARRRHIFTEECTFLVFICFSAGTETLSSLPRLLLSFTLNNTRPPQEHMLTAAGRPQTLVLCSCTPRAAADRLQEVLLPGLTL